MQSHWPGLPCESTPEALTRVGLPVARIETLQCFGSSVLSWLFLELASWRSAPREGRILEGAREGYAVGLAGEQRGTWCRIASEGFSNYAICTGSQDTRCLKKRPCDQRRSSL